MLFWLATGVLAGQSGEAPSLPVMGGGSGKPWWRNYAPVRLTKQQKEELAEEVIALTGEDDEITVKETKAALARLDVLEGLRIVDVAAQEALARDVARVVNRMIEAADEDDEEAALLLH